MWKVLFTETFEEWLSTLDETDHENTMAMVKLLVEYGPSLTRPYADTIKGSAFSNMKELRVQSKGKPIRAFFAFDPNRAAVVLCAGKKAGKEKSFYKKYIAVADKEFSKYLKNSK